MRDDEHTQTLFGTLQQLSGARYSEIAANARDPIDFDLLRLAREKGVALPTAGETDRDKFHGGFVVDSQAGHHENVVYEDVASLYPNIIRTCNISFETIVGTPADLFRSEYDESDCVWSYVDPRPVKHLADDELYSNFTDGEYKMVYDPTQQTIKWKSPWDEIQDNLVKCYFLDPQQYNEGLIASRADDYIRWNKQYTGVMYSATKRQRNCFTPDTEVVTPDGICSITDLDVGDTVYSLNPDTHTVEEKPVTATHEYPEYSGPLVSFQSPTMDFKVTQNHRMLVRENGSLSFVLAGEIDGSETTPLGDLYPDPTYDKATNGVYCVTVADNHTLLAGRNGTFQWTGQSLYGVNGDTGFRLFDWRCAESVTIAGRLILGFMMDFFLGEDSPLDGYIPLGDTDGIGLAITSESGREATLRAVEAREDDAHEYGFDEFARETFGVATHYIETEAETYSPRVFIPDDGDGGVKKTYAKWVTWDEGDYCDEIDVTGFESVRSDVADVTPEMQETILEMLLRNDASTAREKVFPYVRTLRDQFESETVDVTKIGKRMGLSKHPSEYGTEDRRPQPIFRGAKYAEAYIDGESFEGGGKPFEFRVTKIGCEDHPESFTDHYHDGDDMFGAESGDPVDVISVEDPSNIPDCAEIAYTESPYTLDGHWTMTVANPLDNIFRAMGWSLDDALDATEQSSVGEW